MKCGRLKKGNGGFTLVEMLTAAGILAILLAVGIVAVVYYMRWLQITELDNTAREIYLAAENRAVLLNAGRRLEDAVKAEGQKMTFAPQGGEAGASLLSAGGGDSSPEDVLLYYVYYEKAAVDGAAVLTDLLPDGTIDPALREGCFYIVYDVYSGSVTDVFFAEDAKLLKDDDGGAFEAFYQDWRNSSRGDRIEARKMIGYYGGDAAGTGKASPLSAPKIEIFNEERLWVQAAFDAPLDGSVSLKVWLEYDGCQVELDLAKAGQKSSSLGGVTTWTYTWVLDTLEEGGPRFQDLFLGAASKPGSFGGDFTVKGRVTQGAISSPVGEDTDNSLFAIGSDGDTAYIENLRHLQNLDKGSKVETGKTKAVQIADIDCGGGIYADYAFVPIENGSLKSYCGSYAKDAGTEAVTYSIKGLTVTKESSEDKGRNGAGLFSEVSGAANGKWIFKDIRLVNTRVDGGSLPTGALVGKATNADFTNCWVYWEGEELEDLKENAADGAPEYQIVSSGSAGGMAGELTGATVEKCLAATLVEGADAGGLISKSNMVTVKNSYADCYLTGKTVGGLIGQAEKATIATNSALTLENVYTAGFIYTQQGGEAAGICNINNITITAKNVYSAVSYPQLSETQVVPVLGVPNQSGFGEGCYYLKTGIDSVDNASQPSGGLDYEGLVKAKMGDSFGQKLPDQSHPYNLLDGMALTVYPFPGLKDLPHYGDWNAEFLEPALVYFEQYKDSTYGFYGGSVDCLLDEPAVVLDGYAIAFKEKDLEGKDGFTITFTYEARDDQGEIKREDKTVPYKTDSLYPAEDAKGNKYLLASLPVELINSGYAAKDFYQYLKFTISGVSATGNSTVAAYNPHFARTAEAMPTGVEEDVFLQSMAAKADRLNVSVRTPRHLWMLSAHSEYYYTKEGRLYTFSQELDLNYTTYTGYRPELVMAAQLPIGSLGEPFVGVYNGNCHTIQGVRFQIPKDSGRLYAGLFGYSAGTLNNVVYLMDADVDNPLTIAKDKGAELYIGGLAGGNSGSIINCAVAGVSLKGDIYSSTYLYLGGLVGWNDGKISNSAAESALLFSNGNNYSHAYTGGLVGRNTGTGEISASYAMGYISAKVDIGSSQARVCGFVGYNEGTVRNSYAAARLESTGDGVETFGFCGERRGSQSGTFFLNNGNFEYYGTAFNASYATDRVKATPIAYEKLTAAGSAEIAPLENAGMSLKGTAAAVLDQAGNRVSVPFPTAVTDGDKNPVHYGQWPEPMDLGIMGVYYWEKLELPAEGTEARTSYDISLLAVDVDLGTVEKLSTLSTAHTDGGVVTDYGYGWYYATDGKVSMDAKDIFCTEDGTEGRLLDLNTSSDDKVDKALKALMPLYTFHSYHSFVPNPAPNQDTVIRGGLYPTGSPNGTMTLTHESREGEETKAAFMVNPHFADALSWNPEQGWNLPEKQKAEITTVPGTDETNNPYEVRAVEQLFSINWNGTTRNTKTVIKSSKNCTQFLYLSYELDSPRKYCWLQTHDLNGSGQPYTPIAEYFDNINDQYGSIYGWFGGSYDGGDYVIENVSIQGQTASCTGLFGIVYNGVLKNIILYSSDGTGKVSSGYTPESMKSNWYSIGSLAGVAASDSGTSAVQNCSVAGYTVEITTYQMEDFDEKGKYGGSSAGGLLGISTMDLTGCSAVTNVVVKAGAGNPENNKNMGNDNMRIGGLVGTCQKSMTNCYAGGAIQIKEGAKTKDSNYFYIGGLVGGSYMKQLRIEGKEAKTIGKTGNAVNNALYNCYSYVELPQKGNKINGLYVLGGVGDVERNIGHGDKGDCTIANSYYLGDVVLKNNPKGISGYTDINDRYEGAVVNVTHAQLSGQMGCDLLNGNSDGNGPFYPVTAETTDGFGIPGKYSYVSADKLQGLNYPFPTILTRVDDGVSVQVHYGDWPLNGIERANGAEPIEVNLFSEKAVTNYLTLSDGVAGGGIWDVVSADETIAAAWIEPAEQDGKSVGVLSVQGAGRGLTEVTVSYTVGGVTYTMPITVHVDAMLRLQPETMPVCLFTGDTVKLPLYLCDAEGAVLNLSDAQREALEVDVENSRCGNNSLLESAKLTEEDGAYYLELTTVSALEGTGEEPLSISVLYEYLGQDYTDISTINLYVVEPEVEEDAEQGTTVTFKLPGREILNEDGTTTEMEPAVKVLSAEAEPAPPEDTEQGDGNESTEQPEGNVIQPTEENGLEMNQIRLEGFTPGAKVVVTAELEVTPVTAGGGDAEPQTHRVVVTVNIPEKPSEGGEEGEPEASGELLP